MDTRLVMVLLLAAPAPAQEMVVRKLPVDHMSISVPAGWVGIPKAALEQMSANVREAAPSAKPQPYNYGFHAAEGDYPRVLIQVKNTGRWPEKLLAEMPTLPSVRGEVQRGVQSVSPAFAALHLQVGKLTYDPGTHVVWLKMRFTPDDGRTLEVLSGLHPTNAGSIQVHCYAPVSDFDSDASLFSEIIQSVQIEDAWKYRERTAISRALGSVTELGSSAVAGAIAAVVVLGLLRRRAAGRRALPPMLP